jgi:hypothetical protein
MYAPRVGRTWGTRPISSGIGLTVSLAKAACAFTRTATTGIEIGGVHSLSRSFHDCLSVLDEATMKLSDEKTGPRVGKNRWMRQS